MGSGAPSIWTASSTASVDGAPPRLVDLLQGHPAAHNWGISVIRSGESPVIAPKGTHMRKFVTSSLAPALAVFLGMTALAACGGTDGATDTAARAPAESRAKSDTWAASASPTTGAHTETSRAGATKVPHADTYDDVHFVCPEGAMGDVIAMQQAVDEGHQP